MTFPLFERYSSDATNDTKRTGELFLRSVRALLQRLYTSLLSSYGLYLLQSGVLCTSVDCLTVFTGNRASIFVRVW
jgi:hypothetical protein